MVKSKKTTARAETKKAEIAEAILDSLAEHGIRGTTYQTVAKKIAMAPSHVAYYYKNWASLILAGFQIVITTAQSITVKNVSVSTSPQLAIEAIARSAFQHIRENPKHRYILAQLMVGVAQEDFLKTLSRAVRQTGRVRLQSLLIPIATPDLSNNVALHIQALITGYVVEGLGTHASTSELAELEEACVTSLRKYLISL